MERIDTLIESVFEARRINAAGPDNIAGENGCSWLMRKILGDSRRVCRDQSEVDFYLGRAERVLKTFRGLFPESSEVFLIRAPGRVNLIGEHTDYNGLPVLPIAINRDVLLVASPRSDGAVHAHNTDARFQPCSFNISESIEPYAQGEWGNYAKAAAQSMYRLISETKGRNHIRGFDTVVDGNIPMASGLASSSALVVAFGIALLAADNCEIDRPQVAETLARGEQYVGTRGGGMDQFVCLMGHEGCVLKIEFFPTRSEQIPLPADYSFVVCHSMVEAPKTTTVKSAFNLRAAESNIAAAMLGKALAGKTEGPGIHIQRLGDLYSDVLRLSEDDIDSLVRRVFTKKTYSFREISNFLELDEKGLFRSFLAAVDEEYLNSISGLKLRGRSRHVITEGRRVRQAADAIKAGRMDEFGTLMCQSHDSCANDYEISIPALDTLVSMAKEAGALGARLTGAGFGGCVICLVHDAEVERFVEEMEDRCYGDYPAMENSREDRYAYRSDHIFVCKSVGAAGTLFL